MARSRHYDIVIGDEAWDLGYHYHGKPELKRQPFVILSDFVGYAGYALPFDPKALADTHALRTRHGWSRGEKLVIVPVGGTAIGGLVLHRIAETFPILIKQVPALRMVLVAGPLLPRDKFPEMNGLDVLPYVQNLFEHLTCADLALVQGGLCACMELVATRRPFLHFLLERHFEQCIHVTTRMRNYCGETLLARSITCNVPALSQCWACGGGRSDRPCGTPGTCQRPSTRTPGATL